MKKISKYTLFHEVEGNIYLYHQVSGALLSIDAELRDTLKNGRTDLLPPDISDRLKDNSFLVDTETNESTFICYANIKKRYNSRFMRVTVMPTLNCNFRCWYCYEQHKHSLLTDKGKNAILHFIKSEIENNNLKNIVLDWFGGEPLLRFYQTIFPLSKELSECCKLHHIGFTNTITTNGSLINKDMALKMNAIGLKQFQITLDGGKDHHNRVRKSASMKNSYDIIVNNIHTLCHFIDDLSIELRINYTKDNIDSIFSILDSFDKDIRHIILVSPHIVWQETENISSLSLKIDLLKRTAFHKGYNVKTPSILSGCMTCYTENMEQFVINYDMNVYKCTARDFDEKLSIGRITPEGKFEPNQMYYKYYITRSPFMRKQCLECDVLPSCLYSSSCIQKKIEGYSPECDKAGVIKELQRNIEFKVKSHETR